MCEISFGRIFLQLLMALITLAFASCTSINSAGTSSGVETKIARGSIVHEDGSAAAHARVWLIPVDYDPQKDAPLPKSYSGVTGVHGEYEFSANDTGIFNVQAVLDSDGCRLLIRGIHMMGSTTSIPKGTLHAPGAIKVIFPDSIYMANGYIYIPGTDITVSLDGKAGNATLDSVPAGSLPPIHYALRNVPGTSRALTGEVIVQPDSTTEIVMPGWKYSANIFLNTTVNGANVNGNVTNFPLCVRLNNNNFNFSQTPTGSDIRFTKKNGALLRCETELWDAAAGRAVLWVKVDTVFGNDSSQYINMYWGNDQAVKQPDNAGVFDTMNNFSAVWHLGGNCKDASPAGNNGSVCSAEDTDGIIGMCKKFNGNDSIMIPGMLGSPANVTLSAWVKLDTTISNGGSEVLSIGDAVLMRMDYNHNSLGCGGAVHVSGSPDFNHLGSGIFLGKTGWHFMAFTFNDTSFTSTIYIDGVTAGSRTDPDMPIDYSGVGMNTYFGKHGNGKNDCNFKGCIDEVRVSQVVKSADFIKLSYMNQRSDDKLLTFK